MDRRYLTWSVLCLIAFLVCGALYSLNGARVDEDGILRESFGFIPLGWLFLFSGMGFLLVAWLRRK